MHIGEKKLDLLKKEVSAGFAELEQGKVSGKSVLDIFNRIKKEKTNEVSSVTPRRK